MQILKRAQRHEACQETCVRFTVENVPWSRDITFLPVQQCQSELRREKVAGLPPLVGLCQSANRSKKKTLFSPQFVSCKRPAMQTQGRMHEKPNKWTSLHVHVKCAVDFYL